MKLFYSKSLILFGLLLICAHVSEAQIARYFRLDDGSTLRIENGRYSILKGGQNGKEALGAEQIQFFPGGKVFFREKGRWGLADLAGNIILEAEKGFFLVRPISEGLAWVAPGSGDLALLGVTGKLVNLSEKVQNAYPYHRGVSWARVSLEKTDRNPWILLSATGKALMRKELGGDLVPYPTYGAGAYWLNQGGMQPQYGPCKGGRWALVDKTGNFLIQWDEGPNYATPFVQGLSWVNRSGKWLQDKLYGGEWGLIDTSGKYVLEPKRGIDQAHDFSEGLAWVLKGGKLSGDTYEMGLWGIMETNGKFRVEPTLPFTEVSKFHEKRSWVRQQNGYAMVNISGTFVVPPDSTIIHYTDVHDGHCWIFTQANKWLLMTAEGVRVTKEGEGFDDVRQFSGGFAWGRRNGQWGLVDNASKWKAVASVLEVRAFSEGLAAVQFPNGWVFMNTKGQTAFDGGYQEIRSEFQNGRAEVVIEGISYWINNKGEILAK